MKVKESSHKLKESLLMSISDMTQKHLMVKILFFKKRFQQDILRGLKPNQWI